MLTVYGYNRCGTCRKAQKWLETRGRDYSDIDITENAPSADLLRAILAGGDYKVKDLFNKSGVQYRELNMKDKLPSLSEDEAIELLAGNGRLCKRPIVTDGDRHTVGFKEIVFEETWG